MKILILSFDHHYTASQQAHDLQKILKSLGHLSVFGLMSYGRGMSGKLIEILETFEPDLVITVNQLRHSFGPLLQKYKVASWMQDGVHGLNNLKSAGLFNETDDFLFGYTNQFKDVGYDTNRLINFPMLVNPEKFYPSGVKKCCDLVYVSNKSKHVDAKQVAKFSRMDPNIILKYSLKLNELYKAGGKITDYKSLRSFLGYSNPELDLILFWWMNDLIYRRNSIEWMQEIGLNIDFYGNGWEESKGFLEHSEVSAAYQAGKYALHLNAFEGDHQRFYEILMSGTTPLTRSSIPNHEPVKFNRNSFISTQEKNIINLVDMIFGKKEKDSRFIRFINPLVYSRTFDNKEDLLNCF